MEGTTEEGTVEKSVTARHDDYGTEVSVYVGGIRQDRYYVHAEDGDWRSGIPAGASVREFAR